MDAGGARSDRGEHHVAGRQREVSGVVLANPEEIHADLVGEHALLDDVADRLSMREWAVILVVRYVAEGVEAEVSGNCAGASLDSVVVKLILSFWIGSE